MFKTAQAKALAVALVVLVVLVGYFKMRLDTYIERVDILKDKVAIQAAQLNTLKELRALEETTYEDFSLSRNIILNEHRKIEDRVDDRSQEIRKKTDSTPEIRRRELDEVQIDALWDSFCLTTVSDKCKGVAP